MVNPILSLYTIDVLANVISGGPGNSPEPPIGIYRSGADIEKFMRSCGVDFGLSGWRIPSLTECLLDINRQPDGIKLLTKIIEMSSDSRSFRREPGRQKPVIDELNSVLRQDGMELQMLGERVRLMPVGNSSAVTDQLSNAASVIDFDTVKRDLDRALESADNDPEDAVTAACSIFESVCRSVLAELDEPLPAKKDIQSLYRAVRGQLDLNPDRSDLDKQIAEDVRKILSGLITVSEGIGALRSHAGDAHGRERGYKRIDGRIARLAIHGASTLSLFIIETWQKKFPARDLHKK